MHRFLTKVVPQLFGLLTVAMVIVWSVNLLVAHTVGWRIIAFSGFVVAVGACGIGLVMMVWMLLTFVTIEARYAAIGWLVYLLPDEWKMSDRLEDYRHRYHSYLGTYEEIQLSDKILGPIFSPLVIACFALLAAGALVTFLLRSLANYCYWKISLYSLNRS